MANRRRSLSFSGLGTVTFVTPTTGQYSFHGSISLPNIVAGDTANSAVVVTINQNASPVYTGVAGARGFGVSFQCTAADSITIVLTSAALVDQNLNVIKSVISISEGEI